MTALDPKTRLSSASRFETHELSFTSSIYYLVVRDQKYFSAFNFWPRAAGAVFLPRCLETVKKNFEEIFLRFRSPSVNFSVGGAQLLAPLRSYRQPFFSTGLRFSLGRFVVPGLARAPYLAPLVSARQPISFTRFFELCCRRFPGQQGRRT
jgi:hypothetical protein